MLSKLIDVKRVLLISPELLCILFIILLLQYQPDWFSEISSSLNSSQGLPRFIGGLPAILVGVSYKLGMDILRPGDEDENKVLYEWPLYWALEIRVYSSLIICGVSTAAAVLVYLNPLRWSPEILGALLIGALLVSVITVLPLVLAKMTIRKILTLYR